MLEGLSYIEVKLLHRDHRVLALLLPRHKFAAASGL